MFEDGYCFSPVRYGQEGSCVRVEEVKLEEGVNQGLDSIICQG